MKKELTTGDRVKAKDTFLMLTGGYGHEEFEACGHNLIKLNVGDVSVDYKESKPDYIILPANMLGLSENTTGKIRKKHENTLLIPILNYQIGIRPKLRKLHSFLSNQIKRRNGCKALKGCKVSWNIFGFTTVGPQGHICRWKRLNTATKGTPMYAPVLTSINGVNVLKYTYKEQLAIVGDIVGGRCSIKERQGTSLYCDGE
jgi:hypothetical protein